MVLSLRGGNASRPKTSEHMLFGEIGLKTDIQISMYHYDLMPPNLLHEIGFETKSGSWPIISDIIATSTVSLLTGKMRRLGSLTIWCMGLIPMP